MRLAPVPLLAGGLVLASLLTIHVLPQLASVLLLLFAGVVVAVLLDAFTNLVQRCLPVDNHALAFGVMLACVLLILAGIGALIGPQIASETPKLVHRIPQAWHELIAQLNNSAMPASLGKKAAKPFQWIGNNTHVMKLLSSTFGGVFSIAVVIFVALYTAATPRRYLQAMRHSLSPGMRVRADRLGGALRNELLNWIIGRSICMVIVGVASGVGLWLLGVPLAFTLGLLAGVLSFVPYIGPILGLIPAVLLAGVESLPLAGWVIVLYAGVHLMEATLLTPLIQQRAISLPPVILISVQLVGGTLIGPLGVLLAAPLVVCAMVIGRDFKDDTQADGAGSA